MANITANLPVPDSIRQMVEFNRAKVEQKQAEQAAHNSQMRLNAPKQINPAMVYQPFNYMA